VNEVSGDFSGPPDRTCTNTRKRANALASRNFDGSCSELAGALASLAAVLGFASRVGGGLLNGFVHMM
jgi:hypothetical protein